ncbi:MmgE/PrpD family protein [Prauserella cavernicola]|uniref:MmgE/PrpD family protein n=1 Tax=Prauserella cavernicola TaxID=2800127 RepID=A0A934V818_9PSEU|nr:MmgE/PrpD family protein [Prauserella cavernicola]MBK1789192.1 MmgE/PrpD family protein [Prauserella cavernicola]
MTTAQAMARFAATVDVDAVPAEVASTARRLLLDHLGTVLGGMAVPEARSVVELVRARGGRPAATVLGGGFAAPEPDAAFCNGAAADVLEHQDGYRFGGFHPSHTLPALVAVAESRDRTVRELLTAAVVAYEIANRIGRALHPQATQRGWFPTAAAFGAAAGCARLLRLPPERIEDALGATAFFVPAVLIESIFAGPTSKPAFAGQLARAGVEGALHAEAGLTGWREAVDGPRGLVSLLGGDRGGLAADTLGSEWTVLDVHQKLFAGCRHTHGAAQACAELAREHDLSPDQVDDIDVETYGVAMQLVDRPVHPGMTTIGCTLSLPYVAAAAVVHRGMSGAQYSPETVTDPGVHRLADTVRMRTSDELDARYPEHTATRVTLGTRDGARYTRLVTVPAGDCRSPLSDEELVAKFLGYTAPSHGEDAGRAIAAAVLDPAAAGSVRDLVDRLATDPQPRR